MEDQSEPADFEYDPEVNPPQFVIDGAKQIGYESPADRPWRISPYPLRMVSVKCGCMCGGKFGFDRLEWRHQTEPEKGKLLLWLGQCNVCRTMYWSMEI